MNRLKIEVKKLRAIVLESGSGSNFNLASNLNLCMNRLGFVMSPELFNTVESLEPKAIISLANKFLHELRCLKGDDVAYKPMYPDFPMQVIGASDAELYFNAVRHYNTHGTWLPEYQTQAKERLDISSFKMIEIGLATERDYKCIFTELLSSKDSLSEFDKSVVRFMMETESDLVYPDEIPFKETLCEIAKYQLSQGKSITNLVSNATDVLRVMTALSDGDTSLAENTKFKNLPRSRRKLLISALESVASLEDFSRHKNKWVRALHNLHVGDYSKKLYKMAKVIRSGGAIPTFNSKVEALIKSKSEKELLTLLETRPSEFARRVDHLLRILNSEKVVESFEGILNKVPAKILLQLWGSLRNRLEDQASYVVFPKGSTQKAVRVDAMRKALDHSSVTRVCEAIQAALRTKFSELDSLGKVWVDPQLLRCPIPSQQRSASEGLFEVARGTRLPFGDKPTLRFFIYWVGQDIDLSATGYDSNLNQIGQVSYTNLRERGFGYHSGDVTYAPTGASEFIDIDIEAALAAGYRYVAMNVLVYSGPNFSDHTKCYAGFMGRDSRNSGEVYEPASVQQRIDVRGKTRNCIPMIFDLESREAIWVDTATIRSRGYANNVESNRAGIEDVLRCFVLNSNKVSLYELFTLHAEARGTLVEDKTEADNVFSLTEGTTPYDINKISSEFI